MRLQQYSKPIVYFLYKTDYEIIAKFEKESLD